MAASIDEVWSALSPAIDWNKDPVLVTYAQIKAVGGEPRLAAKFDSSRVLPKVLAQQDRFVMPTPNGYLLHRARGAGYVKFPPKVDRTIHLQSQPRDLFTFGPGSSEQSHLRFALRQGVFSDFLDDDGDLWESWSGRRRIGALDYRFASTGPFRLDGRVQIEVDLGLAIERRRLVLVEGKAAGPAVDFNARQLFLPYLDAVTRLPGTPVVPLFFEIEEPGVYVVREYAFGDDDIASIEHRRSVRYRLQVHTSDPYVPGDTVDVPQASSPSAILATVRAIRDGATSYQTIAQAIGYGPRQGPYYAHAARLLGLARLAEDRATWILTSDGERFCALKDRQQEVALEERISRVWLVGLFRSFLDEEEASSAVVAACEAAGLGTTTAQRRLGTVRAWSCWKPS